MLQQSLIAAMALSFAIEKLTMHEISAWFVILFGGAHLLLVFGGGSALTVATFTASAVAASFVFPYLILRVRNGILYSYFIHWTFYATLTVLIRLIFKFYV